MRYKINPEMEKPEGVWTTAHAALHNEYMQAGAGYLSKGEYIKAGRKYWKARGAARRGGLPELMRAAEDIVITLPITTNGRLEYIKNKIRRRRIKSEIRPVQEVI